MKKIIFAGAIFLILVLFAYFFLDFEITGKTTSGKKDYRTFTRAICNESNYCEDAVIICDGNQTIGNNSITGAAVQLSSEWEDFREEKNNLCN